MRLFHQKKNVLLLFTTLGCVALGYFSFKQNEVIDVLNQEILRQASKQHKTRLDKYALEKELEKIKAERLEAIPDTLIN